MKLKGPVQKGLLFGNENAVQTSNQIQRGKAGRQFINRQKV